VLVSYELELQRFTSQLNRIEAVLTQRKLDCLSTAQLCRLTSAPLLTTLDVEASPAATSTPAPTEAQL